jgi:hypothetical protein
VVDDLNQTCTFSTVSSHPVLPLLLPLLLCLVLAQPQNVDDYPSDDDVPPPTAQQGQAKGKKAPAAAGACLGHTA